jgi:hypothetical protein
VAVPLQVEPEKKLYATVPPAWKLFIIVAEAEAELPTTMVACDRVMLTDGFALFTVRDWQGLVVALLLASPL